ncbi:uncharacterized protein LY79DRAFT_534422 [Colletotrichum navitas]|uniref:Uncharacterized protein n=1 Tax=Colletotrichum navitas TaxID=681940 RepID=A0AAD8QDZ1_9PEZI|nr:uncharacterized protein LY79DRAFT_534422 [Colletotrichum navitas]KAK1600685.1 hypothetical protein LY79DRAFT_534422 [Colletotrichum navitas]
MTPTANVDKAPTLPPSLTTIKRQYGLILASYSAARSLYKAVATTISNHQSSLTLPNRVNAPEVALLLPCSRHILPLTPL